MKGIWKKLIYFYERWMWYVSIATAELDKPLNIVKYASYGAILFRLFGVQFSVWWVVWISIAGLIICGAIGIMLVKLGIVEFVQKLNNSQNAELLKILKSTSDEKHDLLPEAIRQDSRGPV